MGGWWRWDWLVQMEWHPARWSVCLPLLITPCTIKSRSSLLAPAHPGGRKTVVVCVVVKFINYNYRLQLLVTGYELQLYRGVSMAHWLR